MYLKLHFQFFCYKGYFQESWYVVKGVCVGSLLSNCQKYIFFVICGKCVVRVIDKTFVSKDYFSFKETIFTNRFCGLVDKMKQLYILLTLIKY